LTVTNAGGQSAAWEEVVTVVPPPEVASVAPDRIVLGDTVELVLYGKHFQKGSVVWLGKGELESIGEATWVSPTCLKIRLKTTPKMSGRGNDVILELPDGPKTKAGETLVYINSWQQVFMVATVLLDEESAHAMREFRDSLEWKLRPPPSQELRRNYGLKLRRNYRGLRRNYGLKLRRNYNLDLHPNYNREVPWNYNLDHLYPIIDVLLPAKATREEGALVSSNSERPLSKGMHVWFKINGQGLSGTVISKPFAVFSDDYFENKRVK
jgi:hypothetical protein